jgi:hypothetical protein
MAWIKAAPHRRAGVFVDESWWVLWPRPAESWGRRRRPQRVTKAKSWKRGERPPSRCLYAQMDVNDRTVKGAWHPTWNQDETWAFLQEVIPAYAAQGVRYLVIFWDHAPWHVAAAVRQRVAAYNAQAKREGTLRVALYFLPIKAPWLMPLEPVFGQTKRAVGLRKRATFDELEEAVDRRLKQRNARVRARPSDQRSTSPVSA